VSGQEAVDKLTKRYHSFAKRMHQTDEEELLEMFLTSLTSALDPHTSYMSPSTLENFEISMRLELEGIGAALQAEDGYVTVNKIIPGGAADKQGEHQRQEEKGHNGERHGVSIRPNRQSNVLNGADRADAPEAVKAEVEQRKDREDLDLAPRPAAEQKVGPKGHHQNKNGNVDGREYVGAGPRR
jgi:carboxyl-terminal processing protease